MIIEYQIGKPDFVVEGNGWTALRWKKNKVRETNIIYHLWSVIKDSKDASLEDLYEILMLEYKNSNIKSRAEIYKNKNSIEITNGGTVSINILIERKQ